MNVENNAIAILIVDDEESMCQMLSVLFRREGYQFTARSNPIEALELVRQNQTCIWLSRFT